MINKREIPFFYKYRAVFLFHFCTFWDEILGIKWFTVDYIQLLPIKRTSNLRTRFFALMDLHELFIISIEIARLAVGRITQGN